MAGRKGSKRDTTTQWRRPMLMVSYVDHKGEIHNARVRMEDTGIVSFPTACQALLMRTQAAINYSQTQQPIEGSFN